MKKKMLIVVIVVIVVLICISLLGCKENERALNENSRMRFLDMRAYSFIALDGLIASNKCIIDSLYASDVNEVISYGDEAIMKLSQAEENMKQVILESNFILEEMRELQENYKRTNEIIKMFPNISDEEIEEMGILIKEGTYTHIYLMEIVYSFSNLYSIREFDSLPDDVAREELEERWCEFGFEDSVECPEVINEQKLYLIWAEQFSKKELSQSIIDKIELLRANDNLTNKDQNNKWMELVQEICSTQNGM